MGAEQLIVNSSSIIIICTINSAPPPPTKLEYPDYYKFYVPNVCTKKQRFCNTLHSAQLLLLEENTNGDDAMINVASLLLMLLALPSCVAFIVLHYPRRTADIRDGGSTQVRIVVL
jgi:hypothetical protein